MKKIIRPGRTMENVRGFPVSLQDMISFCDAPDTLCLANFPLSLWDEVGRASPLPAGRTQQKRRARRDAPYQLVPPKFDDGGSEDGWVMAGLREDVQIKSASAAGAKSLQRVDLIFQKLRRSDIIRK